MRCAPLHTLAFFLYAVWPQTEMGLLTVSNDLKWFPKQPGQPLESTGIQGPGPLGLEACLPLPWLSQIPEGQQMPGAES